MPDPITDISFPLYSPVYPSIPRTWLRTLAVPGKTRQYISPVMGPLALKLFSQSPLPSLQYVVLVYLTSFSSFTLHDSPIVPRFAADVIYRY